MGILLFWFGRYIMSGFKFLASLPFEKVKEIKRKRHLNGIGRGQEAGSRTPLNFFHLTKIFQSG